MNLSKIRFKTISKAATPSLMFVMNLLFLILAITLSSTCCEAQQIVERSQVQQNREAIFNSPDLRYLKNIRHQSRSHQSPFDGRNGVPGDGENNAEGNPQNGRDGQGRNNDDQRNNRANDRPPRDNNDPGERNRSSSRSYSSGGNFGAGTAGVFQFLGYLAIAAMIVAIVVLIVKTFLDREQTTESEFASGDGMELGEIEPERPPGLTPSEEFVRQAHELAKRGDFREAVALLVLGAMSEVERRGLIRYRRGLTQRDYFRALRNHREVATSYRQMVRIYEPLGFGRRTANNQHFQNTLQHFEAGFREREPISEN